MNNNHISSAFWSSTKAELSAEQLKPFTRKARNTCILAGAGSGKTKTLVRLLASDLLRGIPPENIVCFTFTEKAAEELLARIHNLARNEFPTVDVNRLFVGTIHSWCLQYLLKQTSFLNYTPIDELQINALVSRLYDFLELEKTYARAFPSSIDPFLKDLEIFYNEHLSPSQVPSKIKGSIDKFLATLEANRIITFGGMVRSAIEYLRIKGPLPSPFSLFVDEYQDVNPAQVELIRAMLPQDSYLVVVGDDLQCIYNWRGSDVRRILEFQNDFVETEAYRLNINYRSRPEIVNTGNSISQHISLRDPGKIMRADRPPSGAPTVHWVHTASVETQASGVIDIVSNFIKRGIPHNKIAILLRSVLGSGRPIVEALIDKGVPVQCPLLNRGGAFIDDFVIPVFEWLRHEHQDPRNEFEFAEAEIRANSLWISVKRWLPTSFGELSFWKLIHTWRKAIIEKENSTYDIRGRFYEFCDACGIRIQAGDSELAVGFGIASQIIRGIEEVHRRRLLGHTRRSPRAVMNEAYFALVSQKEEAGESAPIDTTQDAVLVSTVHQAKGLEWPIVVIPNLLSKRFPVNPKGHCSSFPDSVAARYGTTIDDERRLFYVAATRARERLFFVDGSGDDVKRRSTFIKELHEHRDIAPCTSAEMPKKVWAISKKDLEEKDPAPLRISLSDLLIYVECPYQYGLRRVVGLQPSVGEELGFGKSLHELIQTRSGSPSPWTESELERHAEEHVFMPLTSAEAEKKSRITITKRLKRLEKLGAFANKAESEITVEIKLGPGIVYGIIDSIRKRPDGSLSIVDWKSSIHDEFLPRYMRQLQFYALALQQRGTVVSIAEIIDVAASDKEAKLITHEVDIRQAILSNLTRELVDCMNGINKGTFLAKPTQASCGACDMFHLCGERWQNDKATESK